MVGIIKKIMGRASLLPGVLGVPGVARVRENGRPIITYDDMDMILIINEGPRGVGKIENKSII